MFARISAPRIIRRLAAPAFVASLALPTAGCDLMEALDGSGGTVQMFATHHATPEDGELSIEEGEDRVFETESGWTVVLEEAYVVTSAISLVHCDGSSAQADLYWGQLPENLTAPDLEVTSLGSVEAPAGQYCGVVVDYEPYDPWAVQDGFARPDNDALVGATMYLRGHAIKGEELRVGFEVRSEDPITVELDLSDLDGGQPFTMAEREAFPRELTVSKTYDRFFDEIELELIEQTGMGDAEQIVLDVLADETRINLGTVVSD